MAQEKTKELYRLLLEKGYPKEFCAEIACKNMNTDFTAGRMLGYLHRVGNPRIEEGRLRDPGNYLRQRDRHAEGGLPLRGREFPL